MRLSALLSALMWACLVWTAPAAAQEDAREAFRKGEAAYSVGNYELAIKEWERAYSIDPRPRIQFNLAQAHERLGQWPEAVQALKLYLENADPDDPTYPDANARLSSLEQRLARTGLILKGGESGGIIHVDDQEWGRTPRPDRIPVDPGSHTVVVEWQGRPAYRASVVVPAGKVITLNVVTPEDNGRSATVSMDTTTATPVDQGPAGNSLSNGLLIGAGAAGAVMIASLAYGINRHNEVKDCGGSLACTPADIEAIEESEAVSIPARFDDDVGTQDDVDSVKTQRMIGWIGTGVFGAAAIGLAIAGVLTRNKRPKTDQRATRCLLGLTGGSCTVSF